MPEISRGRNDRNVALIGRSDRESDRERAGEYYYRVTNRPDIPVRRCENSSSMARERELSLLYLASDFRVKQPVVAPTRSRRDTSPVFNPLRHWWKARDEEGIAMKSSQFFIRNIYTQWTGGILMSCPRCFPLIREN